MDISLKYEPQSSWHMAMVQRTIAALVYASVVLGVFFLYALYGTPGIPGFLFPSILAGEILWIICAVAVARGARWAPYMALVLALITLALSLSQPTHYTFAESGQIVAFLIFAVGAVLQVALIASIGASFMRRKIS